MAKISSHNKEKYPDPTAHKALSKVQRDQDKADQNTDALIRMLKNIIDLSGYDLLARIELRDRKTGRVYK